MSEPARSRLGGRAWSAAIAVGTVAVIVTFALVPFLNPVWVGFEQRRADALAWTGYTDVQLSAATDAILADLVFGPPDFAVTVAGEPVLDDRERDHMRDVRGVFLGLWALAAVSVVVLAVGWRRSSGSGKRRERAAYWQAVGRGAGALAVAVIVLGAIALVAFDALFEAFHRLFFAGGTYTFDPATERLVQLFPFSFWLETSLAAGGVIVLAGAGIVLVARRAGHSRLASDVSRPTTVPAGRSAEP